MVVAMVAMLMVKPPIDEIIDVISVRHRFMTATRSVNMAMFMPDMILQWMAAIRVRCRHFDDVFIDMVAMGMVEMSIMKIIDVIPVLHGHMAATGAVFVIVVLVMGEIAIAHGDFLSSSMMLACVFDGVFNQGKNVIVGDGIDGALPFLSAFDQPRSQKDLETGGNRADLFSLQLAKFTDAPLPFREKDQGLQPQTV